MELLNEGQKLTLSFLKDNKLVEILSKIDKIYNDRMTVELPTYFMRYIKYLSAGSILTVKVFSKAGSLNFKSIVLISPLEDEFTLELDRNSIKFEAAENIPPALTIEKLIIKNKNGIEYACNTIEISMTEIKFNSNTELEVNTEYDCTLHLKEDIDDINFKIIVNERNLLYDTEYSAIYSTMTEESRQNLLYFLYMYSKDDTDWNNK